MSEKNTVRMPADNVLKIVSSTKILVDALRLAILHQENLTKDCFDTTSSDLSKTIESVKKTYSQLNEEFENVKKEVQAGELRLGKVMEEYKKIFEENETLKETEQNILNQNIAVDEHSKIALELRKTLQAYKLLTGIRFNYDDSENIINGYIGIPGNKTTKSTLIPFEIDTKNCNKEFLWDKINEACMDISEN